MVFRRHIVWRINMYAPGLADMFYGLLERDLIRIYNEHKRE